MAVKHGFAPEPAAALKRGSRRGPVKVDAAGGSEKWVAAQLNQTEKWVIAKQIVDGRDGPLIDRWSKNQIIATGTRTNEHMRTHWLDSRDVLGAFIRMRDG